MILHVSAHPCLVHPYVGIDAVRAQAAQVVQSAQIGVKPGHKMDGFRVIGHESPEGRRVDQVVDRRRRQRMDGQGEFDGVPYEKHRDMIA